MITARDHTIYTLVIFSSLVPGCQREEGPRWHERIAAAAVVEHARVDDHRDSFAANESDYPKNRDEAFRLLLNTNMFANSAIGITGALSRQVAAFRLLLKEPDADTAFRDLLKRARPAGQLYALCGLYQVDHAAFLKAVELFRRRTDEVQVQFGCTGYGVIISTLVENQDPDALRLKPGQTPKQWCAENNRELYIQDIYGGGFTWEFAHD